MEYQGDYAEDATVYIMFNTFTSDDPSASSTITNFVNTDVHIHKNDDLTQRNNAAGITVSVDFDGITGSHMIKIDTSDDTVGGFWVTGADYFVRVEGTTIDGATVNAKVGHFSIENRYNPVVDYDGPTKAEMDTAHALLATVAKQDVIDGIVDNILVDTAVIGALGAGLSAIPWNGDWDTEVQSEVNDALVALHLDHLLAADYDPAAKPGTATALLNELVENDGGVSRFTENALEQAPSGTGASAATIADAVWDEAQADHVDAGSFGLTASEIATIDGIVDNILADTNELQTDDVPTLIAALPTATEIQTEMEEDGASLLDTIRDELANGTDGLSALKALIDTIDGIVDNILTDTGTTLDTLIKDIPTVAEFEARSDVAGTAATPAEVATALTNYDAPTKAEMDTAHALLATPAQVNAQVLDVMNVDTFAEPGQEAPTSTTTLVDKIGYIFKFLRNKITNDGTTIKVFADDASTVDQKSAVSESAGTVTRAEFASGP